jgi:ABC-type multidrug transport system permease subunit
MSAARSRASVYVLGVLLALASGWVQVRIHDLLFTALLVLASAMLLGGLRPQGPWRWALLFLLLVPLLQGAAAFFVIEKPTRAEIYESFLVFLPGIVGAYGGAVLRRAVQSVWIEK